MRQEKLRFKTRWTERRGRHDYRRDRILDLRNPMHLDWCRGSVALGFIADRQDVWWQREVIFQMVPSDVLAGPF